MVSTDTRSVGELERCVDTFDTTASGEMAPDERAQLTDALVALAKAYGDRGRFDEEADTIARLDRVRRAGPDDDVDIHLANALANATSVRGREEVYETTIDPDRLDAYRDRIEALYDRRPDPAVAAPLARATTETVHANGKADRRARIGPLLERLERVYSAHPEPDIAASVLRAYAHAELYLGEESVGADAGATNDENGTDRLARAEELYAAHPDGAVAAGLSGILAGRTNADAERTDIDAIEGRIGRIEALADRHPAQEEAIRRWLPVAGANATRASFETADVSRVEHWAGVTVDAYERTATPFTGTWAAVATFFSARASFFDGDMEGGETDLDRLETLEARYDTPVFEHWLGRAMFDAARGYVETDRPERAREMANDLEAFAVGHEDRAEIEAGLDSLRSHAPHVFDESYETDAARDVEERDASVADTSDAVVAGTEDVTNAATASPKPSDRSGPPNPAEPTDPSGATTVDPGGSDTGTVGAGESGSDDGDASDLPGCGSCGEDGCGNCGAGTGLKPPASGPVIVAATMAVLLLCVSVVYTVYRAQHALRNVLDGS